jgi:hypothetical protein
MSGDATLLCNAFGRRRGHVTQSSVHCGESVPMREVTLYEYHAGGSDRKGATLSIYFGFQALDSGRQ